MCRRHGLADQLIFPNGSANYYDRVLELDANARDFFRYFEAPGVEHCMGGPGAHPGKAFDALVGESALATAGIHLSRETHAS